MLLEIVNEDISALEKSNKVLDENPYAIAEEFIKLNDNDKMKVINSLNNEAISKILEYVDEEIAADILEELDINKTVNILNEMASDDAIDILQELDNKEDVIKLVDEDIKILDEYDEEETGSIMATEYLEVLPTDLTDDVFKKLVKKADKIETINQIYVVLNNSLIGIIELKKLISSPNKKVSEIMNTNFIWANSHDPVKSTVSKVIDYDLDAIPILENDRMVGIVTVDDVMENYSDEMEDKYAKFSGLTEEEEINDGVFESFKKRSPWLLFLLILSLFISVIISKYENTFSGITILISFQPIILGLSGNAGTQSLATCVIEINDGCIKGQNAFKYVLKEILTGIILGFLLCLLVFLLIFAFTSIKGGYNSFRIAMVVALATFLTLSFSSFVGVIFPIILNKIKIDPAIASGPFITTINDCLAIVIYFSLATLFLIQMT